MGSFAVIVLVGLAVVFVFVLLIGHANEHRSYETLGLRSARQITETRETLEAEDLEQLLAAHNARRRRRGQPEVSVAQVEMQVARDRQEMARSQAEIMADRELDELLEATNARRRARGLPERTRDDVRREFGGA